MADAACVLSERARRANLARLFGGGARSAATRRSVLAVLLLVALMVLGAPVSAYAATGSQINAASSAAQAWLSGHENTDGTWGSGASTLRDTQLALAALSPTTTINSPALGSWLASTTPANNDFLARRVSVEGALGIYSSDDASSLVAAQQGDGGFSLSDSYASDVWDTQLALGALVAESTDTAGCQSAADFLATAQNDDGGWGVVDDGTSDTFMTAEVVRTLSACEATSTLDDASAVALSRGASWLSVRLGLDGSMAGCLTDTAETALALDAAGVSYDSSATTAWLLGQQGADGGFGHSDARATALAALALQAADVNVTITGVSASDPTPRSGEIVRVTATVANTGARDLSGVGVAFTTGSLGVVPAAYTTTVSVLPAGSSTTVGFNYQVPDTDSPITINAQADPGAALVETDESDNTGSVTLSVRGPLGTPAPVSPEDGAILSSATPTLAWTEAPSSVGDLLGDVVQIDRTPTFDSASLQTIATDPALGGALLATVPGTAPLDDGMWYWRVRTSCAGEVSTWSGPRAFTVDTVAPKIEGLAPSADLFSPNDDGVRDTVRLGFELSEVASVSLSVIDAQGVEHAVATTSAIAGRVSLTWDGAGAQSDGAYQLKVTARDAAGNVSSALSTPVTVDRTVPVLSGLSSDVTSFSPNSDGYRDTVTFAWTGESGDTAVIRIQNTGSTLRVEQVSGQSWTWDGRNVVGTVAPDGDYTVSVQLLDAAGNTSATLTRTITLKTTPQVGSVKVDPPIVAPGASARVSAEVGDDSSVSVTVEGTTYPLADDSDGTFSTTITAPTTPGNYRIALAATDSLHDTLTTNNAALVVRAADITGETWTTDTHEDFRAGSQPTVYTFGATDKTSIEAVPGSVELAGHQWENIGSLPYPRWGSANCLGPDGRIYSFGGWDEQTFIGYWIQEVPNTYVYDPTTAAWSEVPPMPTPRSDAQAVLAPDGRIFVIGGSIMNAPGHWDEVAWGSSTVVEAYDPKTNTWQTDTDHGGTLAPMPTSRAVFGAAVGQDGKIYCAGGFSGVNNVDAATSSVEAYDPVSNTWASRAPLPVAQDCFASAGLDGKLYVFEGEDYPNPDATDISKTAFDYTSAAWAYDTLTDSWSQLPSSPVSRHDPFGALGGDGRIYVYGGSSSALSYVFDPLTQSWSRSTDMLSGVEDAQGVADAQGRVYALGGCDNTGWGYTTSAALQRLTPGYETTGTYVSPVRDLLTPSSFGAITWHGEVPDGTTVALATRTSADNQTWSDWSEDYVQSGSSVTSPQGRYVQFRITMTSASGLATPRVDDVSIVYNQAPAAVGISGGRFATHRPTLGWWGAWDPEGDPVAYNLQVDTSPGFDSPNVRTWNSIDYDTNGGYGWNTFTIPSDASLPDGSYYCRVQSTDGRADSLWSAPAQLTVDTTPPKLTLGRTPDTPSIGAGGGANLTVHYEVDEPGTVQLSAQQWAGWGWWQVAAPSFSAYDGNMSGDWTWNGLSPWGSVVGSGTYRLVASATDSAGNKSVDTVDQFTVRTLPSVSAIEPSSADGQTSLALTTGGDATHASVSVDGASRALVDRDASGAFAGPVAASSPARTVALDGLSAVDGVSGAAATLANAQLDTPGSFDASALTVASAADFAAGTSDGTTALGSGITLPAAGWALSPAQLGAGREGSVSTQSGSKVYLFGGYSPADLSHNAEVIDLATGQDDLLPSMPHTHDSGMAAADSAGRIYVLGGSSDGGMSCVDRYDPATDSWQTLDPMPGDRVGGMAFASGDTIFVCGGYQGTVGPSTMWALDTTTGTWSVKAPMPVSDTWGPATTYDGTAYLIGGFNRNGPETYVQAYDVASDSWRIVSTQTPSLVGLTYASVIGDRIYLAGNNSYTGMVAYAFDPASATFASLPAMPLQSWSAAQGAWDGSIYSLGGYINGVYSPAIWRYQVERVGHFTSAPLDAGKLTDWGRIGWTAFLPADTTLSLSTRTSVDGATWSDWSPVASTGATVTSPAGRYIQWSAELRATNKDWAPVLGDVTVGLGSATSSSITAPQPVSPAGDTVNEAAPTLSWLDAAGGLSRSYEVQLSSSASFEATDTRDYAGIGESPSTSQLFIPSTAPLADGGWFWRVRATDGNATSEWSVPAQFTVSTKPDLKIEDVSAPTTATVGDTVNVGVFVANRGALSPITPLRLMDADSGAALVRDQRVPALDTGAGTWTWFTVPTAGHTQALHLTAQVDPAGAGDSNSFAVELEPAHLEVSVTPSTTALRFDDVATFTTSVTNSSDVTQTGTLALTVADPQGIGVDSLPAGDLGDLAPGEARSVVETWSPAGVYPGDYSISALVRDGSSPRAAAEASFSITPDVNVAARVGVDQIEYAAGENVAVTSRVTNNSGNAMLSGATVHTSITDAQGTVLASRDDAVDDLLTADSRISLFTWDSSLASAGTYHAVETVSLADGTTAASSEETFTIKATSATGDGLIVSVAATPQSVFWGDSASFEVSATNDGNSAIAAVPVTFSVVDPTTTGTVLWQSASSLTIPVGGSADAVGTCPTSQLATTLAGSPKDLLVIAQAQFPDGPVTLGHDVLHVTPITVSAQASASAASVDCNGQLNLTATASNLTTGYALAGAVANVTIAGPSGSVLTTSVALPTIASGANGSVCLPWSVGTSAPGAYAATINVVLDGQTLAAASTGFTVVSTADSGVGLSGTLAQTSANVQRGDALKFAYTLANAGNADASALPASVVLRDASGTKVAEQTTTVNVAKGGSASGSVSFDTAALMPAGSNSAANFTAELSVTVPQTTRKLTSVSAGIAPNTPPGISIAPASGAYASAISASVTAIDNGSGVGEVDYQLDGVAHIYTGAFPITGDGTHTVEYWAHDRYGNATAYKTATYFIDTTAPSVAISPAPGLYNTTQTISIAATDSGSGVAETDYTLDGVAHVYTGAFTIGADGTHTVAYSAKDVLGNRSATATVTYRIDRRLPVSAIAPAAGTYASAITASISASSVVTTIAEVDYVLDGGTRKTYSAPFSIPGEGTHTVEYWCVDAIGNVEAHHIATYRIDTLVPSVSLTPASGSYAATVTASVVASDSGTGVAQVRYTLDGVERAYSGAFAITGDGTHTVTCWAIDGAGNTSAKASATYFIDTTAPSVAISPASGTFTATQTVSIAASDTGSGVAETDYALDGTNHVYSGAFAVGGEGTHTVTYWAKDVLGNTSAHGSATYAIHLPITGPSVTATSASASGARVLILAQTQAEADLAKQAFAGAVCYRITDDPNEFLLELRTGIFNTFVMLDPTTGLPYDLDQELAEHVYSGSTLIASRSSAMDVFGRLDVFGLKFNGYLSSGTRTITVPATVRTPALTATITGKIRKVTLQGATALATISGSPGITYYAYGRGATVYFPFDLASTDTSSGVALLTAASTGTPANEATPGCGDVVAMRTTITNKGTTAIDAVATATVDNGLLVSAGGRRDDATDKKPGGCWPLAPHDTDPDGWRFGRMRWCDGAFDGIYEPTWGWDGLGPLAPPTPPNASWQLHLASGESTTVTTLVRLAWRSGTTTLTVNVAPLSGTAWTPVKAVTPMSVTGDTNALFTDAIAKVRAIGATSMPDRMNRDSIAGDLTCLSTLPPELRCLYPLEIDELLNDTDSLTGINADTSAAHLAIDELIRNYEARSAL